MSKDAAMLLKKAGDFQTVCDWTNAENAYREAQREIARLNQAMIKNMITILTPTTICFVDLAKIKEAMKVLISNAAAISLAEHEITMIRLMRLEDKWTEQSAKIGA